MKTAKPDFAASAPEATPMSGGTHCSSRPRQRQARAINTPLNLLCGIFKAASVSRFSLLAGLLPKNAAAAAAAIHDLGGAESADSVADSFIKQKEDQAAAARKQQEEFAATRKRIGGMEFNARGEQLIKRNSVADTAWFSQVYGIEGSGPQAMKDVSESEKTAREQTEAAEKEAARLKTLKEQRGKFRQRATKAAGEKAKRDAELAPEDAANAAETPGTVAFANAQQAARQRDKDRSSRETADASAFTSDQKTNSADAQWLQTHAPTRENIGEYRTKIKEMSDAMNDAVAILKDLSSLGADTKKLGTALGTLQRDVADTRIIADRALNYAHMGS